MEAGLRIVLLCNAFKGALSSAEAAEILLESVQQHASVPLQMHSLPLCDGGDGTMELLASHFGATKLQAEAMDAHGRSSSNALAWLEAEKMAILDMASVVGIASLDRQQLDPRKSSTYGLGLLMKAALARGAEKIILGIGGSASMDGGIGLLAALGFRLMDDQGQPLSFLPQACDIPSFLLKIATVLPPEDETIFQQLGSLLVLQDVPHRLSGKDGAVQVFGPQKGMKPGDASEFEEALIHFATNLGKSSALHHAGVGAAGGVSLGLSLLPGFEATSGPEYLVTLYGLEALIRESDLVITTEGRLDTQSEQGKLSALLTGLCEKEAVPLVYFVGENLSTIPSKERIISINKPGLPLEENMAYCAEHLREAAQKWAATLPAGFEARK
jgi:glycerate 2-kinase